MKAQLVEDKLTPLTPGQVARSFAPAFFRLTGERASDRTLCILMAQSALESGRWGALHCFNYANIKASEAYEGLYCLYRCNEIINGRMEWFEPPHPQCRFRAYLNQDDGAFDYLSFLYNRTRYRPAWDAAVAGDPAAFVAALKRAGFFTAHEEPYRKAVVSLTIEYSRHIADWREPLRPDPEPAQVDVDTDHDLRAIALEAANESLLSLLESGRHEDPNDAEFGDEELPTEDIGPKGAA